MDSVPLEVEQAINSAFAGQDPDVMAMTAMHHIAMVPDAVKRMANFDSEEDAAAMLELVKESVKEPLRMEALISERVKLCTHKSDEDLKLAVASETERLRQNPPLYHHNLSMLWAALDPASFLDYRGA